MYRKPYIPLRIGIVLAFLVAVGVTAAAAMGDTIRLLRNVRLQHDSGNIMLRDIAELEGEEALRLADIVVAAMDASATTMELRTAEIRAAIDSAGVNWGKVHLNGRDVLVRAMRRDGVGEPLAMLPIAIEETSLTRRSRRPNETQDAGDSEAGAGRLVSELIAEPTLRGTIAALAKHQLGMQGERIRLSFDDQDAVTLGLSTELYRFEIQPQTSFVSGQVIVEVVAWQEGRPALRQRVRFSPRVLIATAVAAHDIGRGTTLMEQDVQGKDVWMLPTDAAILAERVAAIGRIAARDLRAGEVIRKQWISQQTVVERGDMVTVRCLVGGIVITQRGEARTAGGVGESIELRRPGERTTFMAVVTGPGEATVDLARR